MIRSIKPTHYGLGNHVDICLPPSNFDRRNDAAASSKFYFILTYPNIHINLHRHHPLLNTLKNTSFKFSTISIIFVHSIHYNTLHFIFFIFRLDYRTDTSMWPLSIGCRPLWALSPSTCVTSRWRPLTDTSTRICAGTSRVVRFKRKLVRECVVWGLVAIVCVCVCVLRLFGSLWFDFMAKNSDDV